MMIERERLIELIRQGYSKSEVKEKWDLIENTIADYLLENDVVEVVRCKDCKHFVDRDGLCYGQDICAEEGYNCYKDDNDFCSCGERRCNK